MEALAARRCLAVLSLAALCCCAPQARQVRLEIPGGRIAALTGGHGSPAVVFDSGLGDPMIVWSEVLPPLAPETTVFAWDRPGLGRSSSGALPRTSERIVAEMREALRTAGIPPPYVLVGHSFGGMTALLFARLYPDEVSGLVLVEATHPRFRAEEERLRPREGMAALRRRFAALGPTAENEFDAVPESAAQIAAAPPLPPIPLIVVTAARHSDPVPELARIWQVLQKDLAAQSPKGRQVFAANSDHSVMYDDPGVVIGAVRELLAAARRQDAPQGSVNPS